jgi:hypothetical protein
MEISIKLTGAFQLVRGKDDAKKVGGRSDRVLFLGGMFFVRNPKDFPPGEYSELLCLGENWGDQKGLRPRELVEVKPVKAGKAA